MGFAAQLFGVTSFIKAETEFNAEHKKVNQPINQCPKQPFERLKKEREEGVYNQNNGLEHTEQKNGLFLFRIAQICWRTNVYSFFY